MSGSTPVVLQIRSLSPISTCTRVRAAAPSWHQKRERSFGVLELVAPVLELLDALDESAHGLRPPRQVDPDGARPVQDVARPHLVGDQNARLVADLRRIDVLVGAAAPLDGADVDARLVGEGAPADERLVAVG